MVARIALEDPARLTVEDLRQLALLDRVPAERRPGFPAGSDYSWKDLADGGWMPHSDADSEEMFGQLRTWAMTESAVGRNQLMTQLRDGTVNRSTLAELTRKKMAASAGATNADLLRAWARHAAEAGYTDTDTAHADLLQVRKVLRRIEEPDATLEGLLKDVRRLTRRNLERLEGERYDGYDIHPEYAELGRLQAQADLYASLRSMHAPSVGPRDAAAGAAGVARPADDLVMPAVVAETPTAAPEGAAASGEVLSW